MANTVPTKDEVIAALGGEMEKASALINALHGKVKEAKDTVKPKTDVVEKVAKELVTVGVIKAPYEAELVNVLSDHGKTLEFLSNLATSRKEASDTSFMEPVGREVTTNSNVDEDSSFHKAALAAYAKRRR